MGFCPTCRRMVHLGEAEDRICPVCSTRLIGTQLEERRAEKIAHNENAARDVNEQVRDIAAQGDGHIVFDCECGLDGCTATIELTVGEYEHVRRHPAWFAMAPTHAVPEIERVVEDRGRYEIVEKVVRRDIADNDDPRS